MNLINNIKSFLYDEDYFISIYENNIHLYGYKKIIKFEETELVFEFHNFILIIKGDKFLVKRMMPNEILINGAIKTLNKKYEK